ncbi:Protein of unknown function [Gryllus bimaculatus]|nr:Protein of unknown function [Gryllus bimaculatus]
MDTINFIANPSVQEFYKEKNVRDSKTKVLPIEFMPPATYEPVRFKIGSYHAAIDHNDLNDPFIDVWLKRMVKLTPREKYNRPMTVNTDLYKGGALGAPRITRSPVARRSAQLCCAAMTPSPVRRLVLRTGKTCLKVLRSLATPARRHRAPRALPAAQGKGAPSPLDDVADLEDLQNRLNEAAERKASA